MKNDLMGNHALCDCRSYKTSTSEFGLQICVLLMVEIQPHQLTHTPAKSVLNDEKNDLVDMLSLEWLLENSQNCIFHLALKVCMSVYLFQQLLFFFQPEQPTCYVEH